MCWWWSSATVTLPVRTQFIQILLSHWLKNYISQQLYHTGKLCLAVYALILGHKTEGSVLGWNFLIIFWLTSSGHVHIWRTTTRLLWFNKVYDNCSLSVYKYIHINQNSLWDVTLLKKALHSLTASRDRKNFFKHILWTPLYIMYAKDKRKCP